MDSKPLRNIAAMLLLALIATPLRADPATTQDAIPSDQSTPRGALNVLATAMDAGDGAKMRGVLQTSDPQDHQVVDALVAYHEAVARFSKAAMEAFGEADARKLTGDKAAARAQALEELRAMPEEIKGDTAIVGGEKRTQVQLARVDGKWMVPVGLLAQGVGKD